jgi:hypothetical protein
MRMTSAMRSITPGSCGSRNQTLLLAFRNRARAEEDQMKKIFAIMAVVTVVAGATTATATARSHHRGHHHWSMGIRGSNAELRGNNGNSARGSNSLANPNNTAGPH